MRIDQNGFETTNPEFDGLVIALLASLQLGMCEDCGKDLLVKGFQLTHKRYGEDIALKDLALKCGDCHAAERGHKAATGRLRYSFGY